MSFSVGRKCRFRLGLFLAILFFAIVFVRGVPSFGRADCPPEPTEIYQGVTYGCLRLDPLDEGSGAVHWVSVDLAAPGIDLYVTPKDPEAVREGWQYRLRRVGRAVEEEGLAVAINGSMFSSIPTWRLRLAGDLARSLETTISDHVVSHYWEYSVVLSFDDALTPNFNRKKPLQAASLEGAKWGIGAQSILLLDGKVSPRSSRFPDGRTAVGIDRDRKLLFFAVGENVSPRLIMRILSYLGAKDGMLLDGGDSSAMALGGEAKGVSSGTVAGGRRPVATQFGVRARPQSNSD